MLGLHRRQIETQTTNAAMIRAAARAGFGLEGTLRDGAWALGAFADVAVLGLLATDMTEAASASPRRPTVLN